MTVLLIRQKRALGVLVAGIGCGIAYSIMRWLWWLVYLGAGLAILGLFLFASPMAFGSLAARLRRGAGQQAFELFERAGLNEDQMKHIIKLHRAGHRVRPTVNPEGVTINVTSIPVGIDEPVPPTWWIGWRDALTIKVNDNEVDNRTDSTDGPKQ